VEFRGGGVIQFTPGLISDEGAERSSGARVTPGSNVPGRYQQSAQDLGHDTVTTRPVETEGVRRGCSGALEQRPAQRRTRSREPGLLSLDGIHPTNTGYAIIANETMRTMNTQGFNWE
jgi:hypothetical protein